MTADAGLLHKVKTGDYYIFYVIYHNIDSGHVMYCTKVSSAEPICYLDWVDTAVLKGKEAQWQENCQVCQVVRDLFLFGPIGSLAFVSSQSFLQLNLL